MMRGEQVCHRRNAKSRDARNERFRLEIPILRENSNHLINRVRTDLLGC